MSINVYSVDHDDVISSSYITCKTNYRYAIDNIIPLIKKLEIQRKIQNPRFYTRLGEDICNGCIMPPLTLAFIDAECRFNKSDPTTEANEYITKNISKSFVLDGIQRLNTIKSVSQNNNFIDTRPIFFNTLVCPSHDRLLYRMITLNNGQKPMTARHQIEVLLTNTYEFNNEDILILSEKESAGRRIRGAFKKVHFINAYLAFLSDSTNIDNKKIIEEKLDELLATQIIEKGVPKEPYEFSSLVNLIARFTSDEQTRKWFQNENNLIGFCVGIKHSINLVESMDNDQFRNTIKLFDQAFSNADVSKIKVGLYRRRCVHTFFQHLARILDRNMQPTEVLSFLTERMD